MCAYQVMHGVQAGLGYMFFHFARGTTSGSLAGQTTDSLEADSVEYDQR